MRFNPQDWKEKSHTNFEGAWHDGPSVITPPGEDKKYPRLRYTRAQPHPIFATINRLREIYLSMGFDECENPVIVEESDIYRQFGPEAMAVLDRVFYIGGLPRPNVGISRKQLDEINDILQSHRSPLVHGHEIPAGDSGNKEPFRPMSRETEEQLRETLHAYKKSEIDGDELTHELAKVLGVDDGIVVHILDSVFPEFRSLVPESSRSTLRSHMTSGWFMTLGSLWERTPLPIKLFSVDRCFRREQAEGPTRLMTYHSASCVVAREDVTIEDGKAVSEALLSAFGYEDFRFQPDDKRSKYYMPDSQTEVYAKHPVHGWVEVATFGMYSPSALGEYGIGVPVMNLGLGVERLAMIAYNANDVRQLSYPQFFPRLAGDREIACAVHLREEPVTVEGKALALAIARVAAAHATEQGPCSFTVWEGTLYGRNVNVIIEETEANAKLCGPACANEIFVHEGNILGVPDNEKWKDVRIKGIPTGISYLSAVSALAAANIEHAARCGTGTQVQVKMAKHPGDINLKIEEYAMRTITDTKKKVDVRGPVFLAVRSEIAE
ncbi:O-phosphoseryl-tRNA(Cys) synthetase [Methanoregula boonei 6A8]|uniref:O-phosphoserine--tRNA(Cys) ligase n=1 Tax=Methanoregula boonei (strain DSM 21154 / JCM 14090 / 6A8) TaxID=456442 RepID=SEPS_METB6|nr:O-phosphoserine--tRNA ligase [Methanoregula boonei]A7I4Y4.1 RecName: Full=O-phosphoserine--tRNA(Cys) ligase; Short=O-phosphoserine--tRNA ligase; AltName: Full=Non-canonical O-phosphoseryl-tRNA(Cys) synthetase; AltName: Full=O-phosphoseryl-tRNA(Cys) synthetase; Short=SepRS [Methanoregula boonei 6A8]ABS54795.1 O-phosphoseryl-tRNA(Cys) synthetase [Methanoregula boonei 6A8]